MAEVPTLQGEDGLALEIPTQDNLPGAPSEQALSMLNGKSSGSAPYWRPQPRDWLRAEITDRRRVAGRFAEFEVLLVHVLEGAEKGQPLPDGAHRAVSCNAAELKLMLERLNPQSGDEIALLYNGQHGHLRRHSFRYSVEKAAIDSEASW